MRDVTKELLVAILNNPNYEILKVHATVVITLKDRTNLAIKNELKAEMETHELAYGGKDLILTNPMIISYNHRRYQ